MVKSCIVPSNNLTRAVIKLEQGPCYLYRSSLIEQTHGGVGRNFLSFYFTGVPRESHVNVRICQKGSKSFFYTNGIFPRTIQHTPLICSVDWVEPRKLWNLTSNVICLCPFSSHNFSFSCLAKSTWPYGFWLNMLSSWLSVPCINEASYNSLTHNSSIFRPAMQQHTSDLGVWKIVWRLRIPISHSTDLRNSHELCNLHLLSASSSQIYRWSPVYHDQNVSYFIHKIS